MLSKHQFGEHDQEPSNYGRLPGVNWTPYLGRFGLDDVHPRLDEPEPEEQKPQPGRGQRPLFLPRMKRA